MNSIKDCHELKNGVKIPCVGFGTWQTPDGADTVNSVKAALQSGYIHIDTASVYKNEGSVGQAIQESGVNRKDIFITTKLWNAQKGYDNTLKNFEDSLRLLGTDYVDLYLIHWPITKLFEHNYEEVNADTWRAFEKIYKDGKARAIGVSNFLPSQIEMLGKTATVMPMVDQIEFHPGLCQEETVSYCQEHGIVVEAWSPLGNGEIFKVKEMQEIANKYGKDIAQLCVRWCLQKGVVPLPKSLRPERIKSNVDVFDFEITPEDVKLIDNAPCGWSGWSMGKANF